MKVHGDDEGGERVICNADALNRMREELDRLRKQAPATKAIATLLESYYSASECPSCKRQHAPDCKLVSALLSWQEVTGTLPQLFPGVSLADAPEDLGISKYEGDE